MDNILITTSSFAQDQPKLLDIIKESGFQTILNPYGRKLNEAEVIDLIEQSQPIGMIAGVEPLSRACLERARNLKIISRCGIGLDSVDLKAAKNLGIIVTNTPDAPTISVAELTLGMILVLLRRIHVSDASIRQGGWERPTGNLLHGKIVGIIGCGRIGTYLAQLLTSFGCKILGCDVVSNEEECYEFCSLEEIIGEADVISLHLPYSSANHHFMNRDRIFRMKKGAILVNTARGGLVDEDALYEALQTLLGGAALDCFEEEPYNGPLKELDNVLLTAHIGSYAKEARIVMERQAVDNLLDELRGKGAIS